MSAITGSFSPRTQEDIKDKIRNCFVDFIYSNYSKEKLIRTLFSKLACMKKEYSFQKTVFGIMYKSVKYRITIERIY